MLGLTAHAPGSPDLTGDVGAVLDRRLDPGAAAPLAVGVSGGGDSLALLILTLDWARRHGRRVLALTVDHQLNPLSARWTAEASAAAARLGAEPLALAWEGSKPAAGLPAAAREARHRLLARAARQAGAEVLLLGHTADDRAEAVAMRAAGSSVGDPHEWSPSPAWPEGRGVFLLRPLLGLERAALRSFLRGRDETWLDDPANDDLRFARARARTMSPDRTAALPILTDPRPFPFEEEGGAVFAPRRSLTLRSLSAACLSVSGGDRPARRARVEALFERLRGDVPATATLAGARIEADAGMVRFAREIGRQAPPALALAPGRPVVWDGRYEITAQAPGLTVRPLAGLAAGLPAAERRALARIAAFARPALPAIVDGHGTVSCPILAEGAGVRIVPLVLDRLRAACGLVTREGDGDDAARGEMKRGVLSLDPNVSGRP